MAQERRKVGSVSYQEAGEDYFGRRKLRRHAAFWSLWSLGVAAPRSPAVASACWPGVYVRQLGQGQGA